MKALYLGGARSGKSGLAEAAVAERFNACSEAKTETKVVYIATAQAHPSMAERIALHKDRRPGHWQCIEEQHEITRLLSQFDTDGGQYIVMVDCLTLWLTNRLLAGADLEQEIARFCTAVAQFSGDLLLVSTEVGQGLIPDDELSRRFVAASGQMHQQLARHLDQLFWCQAGIGIDLLAQHGGTAGAVR